MKDCPICLRHKIALERLARRKADDNPAPVGFCQMIENNLRKHHKAKHQREAK